MCAQISQGGWLRGQGTHEPRGREERVGDFETLLRNADVVSLHMLLSDSSRGLIGARELGWMVSP